MKPIKKAFSWVKKILGLGFGVVRNHDFIAVEITENLKNIVRSPVIKGGIRLIPNKFVGDTYRFLDEQALPVLHEVAVIHGIIQNNEKNSVAVEKIIERLRALYPEKEGKVYADYAGRLNHRLSDGILSLKESWDQAQDTWYTFFKKTR